MRLGLRLPQRLEVDLRDDIAEAARTAESAGFDSLWVWERLLFPEDPKEPYASGVVGWPESQRQSADPLALLTAAAVVTTRVRLGTSILVPALYMPAHLAKSLATIDQISGGGRVVAGFGAGWSSDELQAVNATRADRGRYLDETIDVCRAVWGPDPVDYRSPWTVIERASVLPKPASPIPILIGSGSGARAVQRIATRADGWLSLGSGGVEADTATWTRIRDVAAEHGRDPDALEHVICANITFTERPVDEERTPFVGSFEQVIEDLLAFAAAEPDEILIDLNLQPWFTDTRSMLDKAVEIHGLVTAGRG
jgi:probable F420-dependent oxidoreductase